MSSKTLFAQLFSLFFLLSDAGSAQTIDIRQGDYFLHSSSFLNDEPCIQAMVLRSFHICPNITSNRYSTITEIIEDSVNIHCDYHNFERAVNNLLSFDPPHCNSKYYLFSWAEPTYLDDHILSIQILREYYPFSDEEKLQMDSAGFQLSIFFQETAIKRSTSEIQVPEFWTDLIEGSHFVGSDEWRKLPPEKLPFQGNYSEIEYSSWVFDLAKEQSVDPFILFGEELREVVYKHMLNLDPPKHVSFNIHQYKPELKRYWTWGLSEEGMLIYYGNEGEFRHSMRTLIPKEQIPSWPF